MASKWLEIFRKFYLGLEPGQRSWLSDEVYGGLLGDALQRADRSLGCSKRAKESKSQRDKEAKSQRIMVSVAHFWWCDP